jgi:hypothetical protein
MNGRPSEYARSMPPAKPISREQTQKSLTVLRLLARSRRGIEAGEHEPLTTASANVGDRTKDLPRGIRCSWLRRLLDSQDVGHGVEGGGLGDDPFGGSQGAADQGVAAVGGVVRGNPCVGRPVVTASFGLTWVQASTILHATDVKC